MKSNLDPSIYGPPESAITTEIIEKEIGGFMSVDEVPQRAINIYFNNIFNFPVIPIIVIIIILPFYVISQTMK